MRRDDDLRLRPGRIQQGNRGGKRPQTFVGEVMRAAKKAGHVGNSFRSSQGRSRSRFGRGRRAAISISLRSTAKRQRYERHHCEVEQAAMNSRHLHRRLDCLSADRLIDARRVVVMQREEGETQADAIARWCSQNPGEPPPDASTDFVILQSIVSPMPNLHSLHRRLDRLDAAPNAMSISDSLEAAHQKAEGRLRAWVLAANLGHPPLGPLIPPRDDRRTWRLVAEGRARVIHMGNEDTSPFNSLQEAYGMADAELAQAINRHPSAAVWPEANAA